MEPIAMILPFVHPYYRDCSYAVVASRMEFFRMVSLHDKAYSDPNLELLSTRFFLWYHSCCFHCHSGSRDLATMCGCLVKKRLSRVVMWTTVRQVNRNLYPLLVDYRRYRLFCYVRRWRNRDNSDLSIPCYPHCPCIFLVASRYHPPVRSDYTHPNFI